MKKQELQEFINGIDKGNITKKMSSLASHFYDLSQQLDALENEYLVVEHSLEVLKSKTYRDLSVTYKVVKSMTPTAINHQINCKEEVITKTSELIVLRKKIAIFKTRIRTLNVFSEMLTNVGHNFRQEKHNIKKGV